MKGTKLTLKQITAYEQYLINEEKSTATVEKYLRDVRAFFSFVKERILDKELMISYKQYLMDKGYAVRSINSMLASVNSFLGFLDLAAYKVKNVRQQKSAYASEEKELTREEYLRLLEAAKGQEQLQLIIQTICATGIRVSELQYFTVEAIKRGEVNVNCKGKIRTILVPGKLKTKLLSYTRKKRIRQGLIFSTRTGKALDRSNIWAQMKRLYKKAHVNPKKIFPHNLRKLFARTFYSIEKDIAKLADILGHGSIETTRIYIMTTGIEHRQKMERLGLVI